MIHTKSDYLCYDIIHASLLFAKIKNVKRCSLSLNHCDYQGLRSLQQISIVKLPTYEVFCIYHIAISLK